MDNIFGEMTWDEWNLILGGSEQDPPRSLRPNAQTKPAQLEELADLICLPWTQSMAKCDHPELLRDMMQLLFDYVDGDTMHEAYAKTAFRVYMYLWGDHYVKE